MPKTKVIAEIEYDEGMPSYVSIRLPGVEKGSSDEAGWSMLKPIEDYGWFKSEDPSRPPQSEHTTLKPGTETFFLTEHPPVEKEIWLDELARLKAAGFSAKDILELKAGGLLGGNSYSAGCKCAKV